MLNLNATAIKTASEEIREIRRCGFNGKVYALPQEVRKYINKLLKSGVSDRAISRKTNKKFKLEKNSRWGKISKDAIGTYHKKWEREHAEKEAIKEVRYASQEIMDFWVKNFKEINLPRALYKVLNNQLYIEREATRFERKVKMPVESTQRARKQTFDMLMAYIQFGQEMGFVPKTIEIDQKNTNDGQIVFKDEQTRRKFLDFIEEHT
jgi:hypothetical protein